MNEKLANSACNSVTSDLPHVRAQWTAFCPPSISSQTVLRRCILKSEIYKISPFFSVSLGDEVKSTFLNKLWLHGYKTQWALAQSGGAMWLRMRTSGATRHCCSAVNGSTGWERRTVSPYYYRSSFDFSDTWVWAFTGVEDHTLRTIRLVTSWKQMTTKRQGLTPRRLFRDFLLALHVCMAWLKVCVFTSGPRNWSRLFLEHWWH